MGEDRWEGVVEGSLRFVMAGRVAEWLRDVAERGFREWADDVVPDELQAALNELEMDKLREGRAGEWAEGVNRKTAGLEEPMRWFVVAAMLRALPESGPSILPLVLPVELARWLLGVADGRYEEWREDVTTPEFAAGLAEIMPGMFGEVEVSEPMRWYLVSSAIQGSFDRG